MNIFVTGGTGFIGKSLVRELVNRGDNVFCLVRPNSTHKIELFGNKVISIIGDITKPAFIRHCPQNIDCIFHLAALIPHGKYTKKNYFQVNYQGTKNIVKYFLSSKAKRFIHVSSVAVYKPVDDYSLSKLKAENVVKNIFANGREVVIVRPTIVYGPGDVRPAFLDLFRYINKYVFLPFGDGENLFHTLYIDNLIDALLLVMTYEKAKNQDFIIGDRPCPRMNEVLSEIYKSLGRKKPRLYCPIFLAKTIAFLGKPIPSFPLTFGRLQFFTSSVVYNISKSEELLGYEAKVKLKQGIRNTLLWYKENKLL